MRGITNILTDRSVSMRSNGMTSSAETKLRTRRKEERPGELIAAALELFVEQGFAATRIDDVARRAGVAKGTAYLYFSTKEELFKAVAQEALVVGLELGEQMTSEFAGNAEDLLSTIIEGWCEYQRTPRSGILKLVVAEAGNFPEIAQFYQTEVLERAYRLFADIIQQGIVAGEFRAVDADRMARVIVAPISFFSVYRHSIGRAVGDEPDIEDFAGAYLDLVFAGLRPVDRDGEGKRT